MPLMHFRFIGTSVHLDVPRKRMSVVENLVTIVDYQHTCYSTINAKSTLSLHDGTKIPALGLGTWKAEPSIVKEAVATAIEVDCAAIYGNERAVGEGISEGLKRAGISREDLFVTSKLWNTEHSSERILPACEQSIHDLGVKYLDLYLMHWPIAFKPGTRDVDDEIEVWETWEAMQMLKHEELVKSLGVSNFTRDQLQTLLEETDDKPSVNQVELHPYLPQPELAAFARENSIHLSAYSPLGTGVNSRETLPVLIEDPFIYTIARKHEKTPAQILIRWSIQSGFSSLPKSVTPQRIKENAQVFDFELDAEDMATIARLNTGNKFVTPDWKRTDGLTRSESEAQTEFVPYGQQ
ncbi:aldo/keto reductase [Planoprotostelium fungivorum]|uniref:Aldo/keto reductase n=1 Tax=Planoprotostelium fungivorum TaxID=1890364 RepID=A0A2P6MYI9_9EUKA|nr:aldo/keto reductase [Planoprotostelium fungivorum]